VGEEAAEALKRMIRNKRNVLAVREEESGNFVGIITRRDLATYIEMLKGSV
jgi:CBS domain-containing protein